MRRSSIILSTVFHATMVVIATLGLPFLAKRAFIIPPPIVIDYIEVSKVTETNKVAPQPQPAPPRPEEKPPAAAKNTANNAVVPVPKEMLKPEDKKEIKKAAKAEPAIDPNAPPDKTRKIKKTEAEKKEPPKDFSSVLKNLIDPKDKLSSKADKPDAKAPPPALGQNAPLGAKMTMSEEDALRTQLEKCWNVPFGAKDVENMAVDIFMVINPDRTLREARVVDQTRYNADNFYRAAADSALRAVRSPLCSPFNLPPDKYDTWNRITVTFNPKDMF
jgi:outer membrane biosynthesis protein TonB